MRFTGLVVVLTLLAAAPAWAAQLTVTADVAGTVGGDPFYSGPQAWYADLPQFDPSLGTLDSVEFHVEAWHNGTFAFQNNNPPGGVRMGVKVSWIDYSFEVNAFGGTGGNLIFEPWVTDPTPDDPFGFPPGHWNLPLTWVEAGEAAGPFPFGTQLDFDDTYFPADPELASFIGFPILPIEILDWAVYSLTTYGQGASAWQLDSECGIYVEATYNYTIPEPSALALFAVAGLFTLRRR